jgi:hypothetical protein
MFETMSDVQRECILAQPGKYYWFPSYVNRSKDNFTRALVYHYLIIMYFQNIENELNLTFINKSILLHSSNAVQKMNHI